MKTVLIILLFTTRLVPYVSAQKAAGDSISVTILLRNKKITVDSVYVIFDRYDLTGAGVVKKVFYPSKNRIVLEKVPKGKYYVDVFCLGIGQQSFSQISTVGKRRPNKVLVPLKTYETYIPGTAVIPSSEIDFSNLIVTQKKFH
jgi:hypothetical protein